jgi:entericidin B
MNIAKRTLAVICTILMGLALAGCNTLHGVGEDVEQGGEAVQDVAD